MAAKAAATLPSDVQVLVTRSFAVPRPVLYQAWTTPDLVAQWWPAGRGQMTVVEIDLCVGGRWRYVMVDHNSIESAFHGVFTQIEPDQRLIYSQIFEDRPHAPALVTVSFSDAPHGAAVTILTEYRTRRERDDHLQYMSDGLNDALDLLEALAGHYNPTCEGNP